VTELDMMILDHCIGNASVQALREKWRSLTGRWIRPRDIRNRINRLQAARYIRKVWVSGPVLWKTTERGVAVSKWIDGVSP